MFADMNNGNYGNLPQTRDEAIRMMFGDDIANGALALEQALSQGPPPGLRQGNPNGGNSIVPVGPPNMYGTPVATIANEVEAEFEMRKDAFIKSIYNKRPRVEKYIQGENNNASPPQQ